MAVINPIFAGVPQLILSQVIAAAEDTKSAKAIEGPRLGTFIPARTPEEAEALQTMAQRLQDTSESLTVYGVMRHDTIPAN